MDDLAAHINRRSKGFQCDFDNVNRAHHARAKAAWLEQQHPLLTGGSLGVISVRDGFEDSCSHISQYTNRSMEKTAKKAGASPSPNQAPIRPQRTSFQFSASSHFGAGRRSFSAMRARDILVTRFDMRRSGFDD
jgi:hypothetical protein